MILVSLPYDSQSTGPSSLTIKIRPVAVSNNGVLLFRTLLEQNSEGCHGWCKDHTAKYGWLVVSAKGLWKERTYATIDPVNFKNEDAIIKESERLDADFTRSFDPVNPPPLLKENFQGTGQWKPISSDIGKNQITWYPRSLKNRPNSIATSNEQITIGKHMSMPKQGNPVRSKFYYAGIALFENKDSFDQPQCRGAQFEFKNMKPYGQNGKMEDIGYDIQTIDGICIVSSGKIDPFNSP